IQLIMATRQPEKWDHELATSIEFGASPRGTIALDRCARAHAWLDGRDFVTPDDVQAVFHDCLRHRIMLTFEAEANNISKDRVLTRILERVTIL
ncbi:MAG: AAA family ATPase, partial [Pseudomonadales bacterium]|nr:AAA family ATPase [Pseudomonadales bacterium]